MDEIDPFGLPIWPAAERNKQPIVDKLQNLLPPGGGLLLEIASGTGQHALHFSESFPHFKIQTSDFDPIHLATLSKRHELTKRDNLCPPLELDVRSEPWPLERADVIYNANMIHIAAWNVAEALFRGAGRLLDQGGLLITYGPYRVDGVATSESNEKFDLSLRSRNDSWGLRRLNDLVKLAEEVHLSPRTPIAMPANNLLIVWDKH